MNASAFPKIIRPDSCVSCSAMHRPAPNLMECRLNPPAITPIIGPDHQGNPRLIGNVTIFPQVNSDMFCKQFKRTIIKDDRLTGAVMEGAA